MHIVLKVLGGTVDELGGIAKGVVGVVVEEAVLPNVPALCIGQLGNGSVEERDGRS